MSCHKFRFNAWWSYKQGRPRGPIQVSTSVKDLLRSEVRGQRCDACVVGTTRLKKVVRLWDMSGMFGGHLQVS